MKILITGIHGFVGSNLVKHLSPFHEIYGVDITIPRKDGVNFTYTWSDLESDQLPEADVIIHLAGKAHDIKNYTNAGEYFEINTGLTDKVFRYFMQSKARKFIFFSSVKAVADQVEGDILTEEASPIPVGPYAESKLAAEKLIIDNFPEIKKRTHIPQIKTHYSQPNTKQVFILRPCMIHGPGNKGNLNLLYGIVKRGIPWPLGAFENKRSFTSIDNLNFVIRQLIERDIPTGIYNMADDESLSTNELVKIIRESLTTHNSLLTTRIFNIPKPLIKTLARLGTTLHLPLNTDRLNKLTENYEVSNEKIKRALGVTAMPVSARDGLRRTIESFK